MNHSRRIFIRKSALGATIMAGIPAIVSACFPKRTSSESLSFLTENNVVLFQGDSITDAGREKEKQLPNNPESLGSGYVFLAAAQLMKELPELDLAIYNRGISGNKVYQLADRWQTDCLELKPGLLSILIGINDYWHMRTGNYNGTAQVYEADFRKLLERTVDLFPGLRIVIGEPFAVINTKAVDESWQRPVREYQNAARNLANEFNAVWVPYQKVFDEAVKYAPAIYWTRDGVHPTIAGAQLMAEAWLEAVK